MTIDGGRRVGKRVGPDRVGSIVQPADSPRTKSAITVYWRPGCSFCRHLRRELDHRNVPHQLVNIWDDPSGAAFVRSVAGGNETVPTVSIGELALVNPGIHAVLSAAMTHAPSAVPAGYTPPEAKGLGRLVRRLLGGDR
jgi:mycoredoxin